MENLIALCLTLFALALAAFTFGPKVLQWFFETLEEWEDIIASAKKEK